GAKAFRAALVQGEPQGLVSGLEGRTAREHGMGQRWAAVVLQGAQVRVEGLRGRTGEVGGSPALAVVGLADQVESHREDRALHIGSDAGAAVAGNEGVVQIGAIGGDDAGRVEPEAAAAVVEPGRAAGRVRGDGDTRELQDAERTLVRIDAPTALRGGILRHGAIRQIEDAGSLQDSTAVVGTIAGNGASAQRHLAIVADAAPNTVPGTAAISRNRTVGQYDPAVVVAEATATPDGEVAGDLRVRETRRGSHRKDPAAEKVGTVAGKDTLVHRQRVRDVLDA